MITCYLTYQLDPSAEKLAEFEIYAKAWNLLVERHGGTHHGYFLPHEGPNDLGVALFSFPSLGEYERYRHAITEDHDTVALLRWAEERRFRIRHGRHFMRPVLGRATAPFEEVSGHEVAAQEGA